MPIITFECVNCRAQWDSFVPQEDMKPGVTDGCQVCGQHGRRIYKPPQVKTFRPYTTAHITGEPVAIESRQQEESLCRKHGVTHDDGAARRGVLPEPIGIDLSDAYEKNAQAIKYGKHQRYNAMKYGDAPKPAGIER